MADAAALNASMSVKLDQMSKDLKKAGDMAEKSVNEIDGKFANIGKSVAIGTIIGDFAAGSIRGLVSMLKDIPAALLAANKEMAGIGDTANRVGSNTTDLQKLRFVGAQNGISGDQTNKDLESFSKAMQGANEEGSKLKQLFADNGIAITTAAGAQRSLNDLIADSARLFQGAKTEQEKIDMARLLGLSGDWIRILEKGPDAFRLAQAAAVSTGNIIDKEIIQKAQDFEEYWTRSINNWAVLAKTAAVQVASAMQKAMATGGVINDPNALIAQRQQIEDMVKNTKPGTFKGDYARNRLDALNENGDQQLNDQLKPFVDQTRKALAVEMYRQAGKTEPGSPADPAFGQLIKPKATNTAALQKDKSSGGGGGLSDEDRRYNKEVDYILQLEKTGRILDAEIATMGMSNAERAKAIELARIGTVTDAEHLRLIQEDVAANIAKREQIEKMNLAIKGTRDAAQFAGEELTNAFSSLLDGGKIEDALNGITKALMKAALQAAILGQGPLAGLLGTAGTSATGGIGGIIGSLLPARASGGPVQKGKTYMVGENGPEMVRFGQNGTVRPNSVVGSGSASGGGGINVVVKDQNNSQITAQETNNGPNGMRQIEILVDQALAKSVQKNSPGAQAMQNRYGLSRAFGRR